MDKLTAYQRGNRDALVEVLNHLRAAERAACREWEKAERLSRPGSGAWARWHAWQQAVAAVRTVENLAATTPDDPEGA